MFRLCAIIIATLMLPMRVAFAEPLQQPVRYDPVNASVCVDDRATPTATCVPIGYVDSVAHTFTPALAGKTIAHVVDNPTVPALHVTPTYTGAVTENIAGVQIDMNDSLNAGTKYVYPLLVNTILNSPNIVGNRPGLTSQMLFEQATANDIDHSYYSALSSVFVAGAADGGISGAPKGFGYGANPVCHLIASATNWAGCIGEDIIAIIDAGASADRRIGVQLESDGHVNGTAIDAAIDIWGGGSPVQWKIGLLFDDSQGVPAIAGGAHPIAAGGTGIKFGFGTSSSRSLYAGIDMSMLTTAFGASGDAVILPANNGGLSFGVAGAGGRIISQTTSGGPIASFLADEFRLTFGGTPRVGFTGSSAKFYEPIEIHGAGGVPEIGAYTSDFVAGSTGSGVLIHPKSPTGNSDTEIVAFQAGNSAYAKLTTPGTFGAAAYQVGTTAGVSCAAGTVNLSTLTITNGIVTHC